MLTRRQLLARGAVGGGALMLPGALVRSAALGAPNNTLKPFVADLSRYIPPIVPVADGGTVDLAVRQVQRVVHPAFAAAPTTVWSYELAAGDPRVSGAAGSWIGPILALDAGSSITVNYAMSDRITSHLLAASIDRTMLDPYVAHPGALDTRFMTHLHGAFVDGANDGNPFATAHDTEWRPGQTETKTYPAQDRAALLWYHQHAHGITHLNVYAGLAGGYLLRDAVDTGRNDNPLGLPANVDAAGDPIGLYEVPLVIQDRMFAPNAAGAALDLFYPPAPWVPEFFGDTMCVNGAVEPFLEIEPRPYRFRIINGCNARFLALNFSGGTVTGARPAVRVIGSDGGFLPTPWATKELVIAPGERYDIVVDFSALAGETVLLNNKALSAPVVNPAGPLPRIMQFRVTTPLTKSNLPSARFDPAGTLTTDTPAGLAAGSHHALPHVRGDHGRGGSARRGHQRQVVRRARDQEPGARRGLPVRRRQGRGRPGEAGQRHHGGLGVRQHDGRHAPAAHAPRAVRSDRAGPVRRRRLPDGAGGRQGGDRRGAGPAAQRHDRPDAVRHQGGPDAGLAPRRRAGRTRCRCTLASSRGSGRGSTSRRTPPPRRTSYSTATSSSTSRNSMMRPFRVVA